jgi:ankyrin repeat protein
MGETARVKTLLQAGADPERADSEGTTPLYVASVNGEAEIVRLLLAAGASPDTESNGLGSEGTPLCAAACWGHKQSLSSPQPEQPARKLHSISIRRQDSSQLDRFLHNSTPVGQVFAFVTVVGRQAPGVRTATVGDRQDLAEGDLRAGLLPA